LVSGFYYLLIGSALKTGRKYQSLTPDPPKVRRDVALSEVTDLSILREAQKELGIKRK
jgi:hypothetical protein